MGEFDLDIDNYDYKDILKLFNLDIDFSIDELKQAKNQVLQSHPDKSGLDKEYFLFFASAYKIIHSIYKFRVLTTQDTNTKLDYSLTNIEYLTDKDEYKLKILENLNNENLNNENFNKWFNDLFNDIKLNNDYNDTGYGEWLQQNDDIIPELTNKTDINNYIDKQKAILRSKSLIHYKEINEFNNNNYCDLANSSTDDYSSDIFSNLQFQDLKRAHIESVIPVTKDDYKEPFQNIEQAKISRQIPIQPLNNIDATKLLGKNKYKEEVISSQRAFNLIKQEQDMEKANRKWWSSLRQLTN
jgi:hypothetical protein